LSRSSIWQLLLASEGLDAELLLVS
jgi:hypothetical protein